MGGRGIIKKSKLTSKDRSDVRVHPTLKKKRSVTSRNIESKKGCKIFSRRSVDLNDEGQWPDYFEWIATQLDRLKAAFGNRIKNLDGLVEVLDE